MNNILYEYKIKCCAYKKQFFILLSIYLLAFCSIFRANFGYVDDLGRTYAGYHGWLDWSRWSTEILATLIHAQWHLTDISPLPQILSCIIMAAGGIILLALFKKERQITFLNIIAAALTGLAPYFLGIISYKFDSPYMALSFLVSVIPFLFYKNSRKLYTLVSIICLLVMCTTYQASSGVYPLIVLFLAMEQVNSGESVKKSLEFIGLSVSCYLVSLGTYWFLLMRPNGTNVVPLAQIIPHAVSKYITYYQMIYHDFTILWIILIVLSIILFVYSVCQATSIRKISALFLGLFVMFTGSFLCFGAYLFINEDAYDIRCMYGFNVFLTLMAIYISYHAKYRISKSIYVILAWCFLVFSLTYGNALSQQKEYLNYRTTLLANDLNNLVFMNTDEIKKVRIKGDIGSSPVIENMASAYPFLEDEIFTGLGNGFWGGYYFYHYLKIPNIELVTNENECNDLPLIKETMYHVIRSDGHNVLIELK